MTVASTRITTNKNNKSKRTRTATTTTTTANTRGWWVLIPKKNPTQQTFPSKKYQPPKHHHPLQRAPSRSFPKRRHQNGLSQPSNRRPNLQGEQRALWRVDSWRLPTSQSGEAQRGQKTKSSFDEIFLRREFWELSGWQPSFSKTFFLEEIHYVYRCTICIYIYMYMYMLYYYYYISSLRWINFYCNWDDISQIEQTSFGWNVYRLLKDIGSIWTYLEDP